MTMGEKHVAQCLIDKAKYAVSQLQDYYGSVMDDNNNEHQEAYGFLTIADYALDDFQNKFSKLEE